MSQYQGSVTDQLIELITIAGSAELYDAQDWIKARIEGESAISDIHTTCNMCGKPIESNAYVRMNDKYVHQSCHVEGIVAECEANSLANSRAMSTCLRERDQARAEIAAIDAAVNTDADNMTTLDYVNDLKSECGGLADALDKCMRERDQALSKTESFRNTLAHERSINGPLHSHIAGLEAALRNTMASLQVSIHDRCFKYGKPTAECGYPGIEGDYCRECQVGWLTASNALSATEPKEGDEVTRLARTVDRKDEQMAELQEHAQKVERERDEALAELKTMTCMWNGLRDKLTEVRADLAQRDRRIECLEAALRDLRTRLNEPGHPGSMMMQFHFVIDKALRAQPATAAKCRGCEIKIRHRCVNGQAVAPPSPAAREDEQCDGCGHDPHRSPCTAVLLGHLRNVCGCEAVISSNRDLPTVEQAGEMFTEYDLMESVIEAARAAYLGRSVCCTVDGDQKCIGEKCPANVLNDALAALDAAREGK